MFHGLPRFSEDLDFSLLDPDMDFDLDPYLKFMGDELGAYGLNMDVEERIKRNPGPIESAFIKGGTLIHLLKLSPLSPPVPGIPENELIRIKLELDCDPPSDAGYEMKYQLIPVSYSVRLYDLQSPFSLPERFTLFSVGTGKPESKEGTSMTISGIYHEILNRI